MGRLFVGVDLSKDSFSAAGLGVQGNELFAKSYPQSGKFLGKSKISKRGNRHLRRAIYLMTSAVVSQNPFFKAYFNKRKKEGLIPQKALIATAHKLIRVIFAMLSHRTYFHLKEAL